MSTLNLNFLKTLQLNEIKVEKAAKTNIVRVPDNGASLRVFKSGAIYPSRELVERFNLEYLPCIATIKADGTIARSTRCIDAVGTIHNAFDMILSIIWDNYPKGENIPNLVFLAPVPKDQPKTDFFDSVGYDDDNQPKYSVLDQGATSFGKQLIEAMCTTYGVTFDEELGYMDMSLCLDNGIVTPNNIYHIPKQTARGANKGKITYIRRENLEGVFPLVPFEVPTKVVEGDVATDNSVEEQVTAEPDMATPEVESVPAESSIANCIATANEAVTAIPEVPCAPVGVEPTIRL